MIFAFAALCLFLMLLAMVLHLFGLPANWLIIGLAAMWFFFVPSSGVTLHTLLFMAVLGGIGEALEMVMLHIWGKKHGGTTKGTLGGMLGAFIGAILGAPFLFGIGALFGALLGAFAGSLAIERLSGMSGKEALAAAWGTMLGRLGGTVLKAAIGFALIAIAAPRIWPS
jgi:Protein of unknown function (DUF456).